MNTTTTKPEITGSRCLNFSKWVRNTMPASSTGYLVSDLDMVLYNYKTRKFMLIETKGKSGRMPEWQQRMFKYIDRCLKAGVQDGWEYLGFHCIRLENTTVDDGRITFDDKLITKEELIKKLSF